MPLPSDNVPIEIPANREPGTGRELRWEDDIGPYYMVVNLTEGELRQLIRAVPTRWARLRKAIRMGAMIQHIDEFRGGAIEPLDPDDTDSEAE